MEKLKEDACCPGCSGCHEGEEKSSQKIRIIGIAAAAAAFAAGMLVPAGWLKIALFAACYLICGARYIIRTALNLARLKPFDETLLMTVASLGAVALGEWAEAAAVMLLFDIGDRLEDIAIHRSRNNIAELMDLKPDHANVLRGAELLRVDPAEVEVGELIVVRPFEKIPLDGIVVEGSCYVDASKLTGESRPVETGPGSAVISGSVCGDSALTVRVSAEYSNSTAAKITELTERAAENKSKSEKFITRFARVYTPAVVGAALFIAGLMPIIDGSYDYSKWIYTALNFLIISCPCGLVISVPLTFAAGIGGASRAGVLFKGAEFFEKLSRVGTVAFDKTGTLTKGRFEVMSVRAADGFSEDEVVEAAAHAESLSTHPIGRSIVEYYGKAIEPRRVSGQRETAGQGVEALFDNRRVVAGKAGLLGAAAPETAEDGEGSSVFVGIDGVFAGVITVGDAPKASSADTIAKLSAMGIATIMLTGDSDAPAAQAAKAFGVTHYRAELLPQDKLAIIEELKKSSSRPVAFVGDGVNDAPVLAAADVGISMGALGSDAAIEASDVVLMTDDPAKVLAAIDCGKKTHGIATQNIILVLSIKAAIIIISLMTGGSMWLAITADVFAALIAIANALRALRTKR